MKPILFNTDMVRRLLDGTKTVTRRVVKPPIMNTIVTPPIQSPAKSGMWAFYGEDGLRRAPYRPGDVLYVRETWGCYCQNWREAERFCYRADFSRYATCYTINGIVCDFPKWCPSIHMPKEAARIFLRVKDVRVERLQEITEDGAFAEGAQTTATFQSTRDVFRDMWNRTIKPADHALYGWGANPWVWVIEFERIGREEDMKRSSGKECPSNKNRGE